MSVVSFVGEARDAADQFERLASRADRIWIASAWASDGSAVSRALWAARKKIETLVVGLDFHQTDPEFLKRFARWVRVRKSVDGTFHPKLYVFERRASYDAIIGSSNLTQGGFNTNVESNVHLSGSTSDKLFAQLLGFIEEARSEAEIMTPAELRQYAAQHRAIQRSLKKARRFTPPPKARAGHIPSLHVGWSRFYEQMLAAEARKGIELLPTQPKEPDTHVGLLEHVGALFARQRRLGAMSREGRRAVGGLGEPYWIFGHMGSAGTFRHIMLEEPATLDRALHNIPLRGDVERAHFDAFVRSITRRKGLGRPTVGSRLLAMKRPDVFLCVDKPNRKGLAAAFGYKPGQLTSYDGYWELMTDIWKCPWWSSARPVNRKQRRVWNGRVALLDVFFYEPR